MISLEVSPAARWVASAVLVAASLAFGSTAARAQEDDAAVPAQPAPLDGAVLGGQSLSAPTMGAPVGEMTGIEAAEVGVLKFWFERLRRIEADDRSGASMAVRQMEALMDREGIRGMEVLAGAFTLWIDSAEEAAELPLALAIGIKLMAYPLLVGLLWIGVLSREERRRFATWLEARVRPLRRGGTGGR